MRDEKIYIYLSVIQGELLTHCGCPVSYPHPSLSCFSHGFENDLLGLRVRSNIKMQ